MASKTNSSSKEQIDRLLKRPGARYFNLNPFDVLQLEPDAPLEEVKKQYRKLSILVHPDKNLDNTEAQEAFDILSKAYQSLQDDEMLEFCRSVVSEARKRLEEESAAAKKKAKKLGVGNTGEEIEDTAALKMKISQLFVEIGQKKQRLEEREAAERKRKREQELEEAERRRIETEFNEKWEQQRDQRVSSWRNFVSGKKRDKEKEREREGSISTPSRAEPLAKSIKKKVRRTGLRPPPLATESRPG